jgi:hypothetical protein
METKEQKSNIDQPVVSTSYLILSGEGNTDTEHQFCMELTTLDEANFHFENFKRGQFKDTNLFIFEAKKIREA